MERDDWIVGSATLTIEVSSMTTNWAETSSASASPRRARLGPSDTAVRPAVALDAEAAVGVA